MALHGRYTVVHKLANGGMAEIFLASQQGHEGFQKPVVLKRILGTIYSDPQFRNMLIDEAHISMSLTHSNIVQVLDLGLAGGRYFLVLELVDGWDLGQVLQRGKAAGLPLPPELGVFVATEICRALAYAHAKRGPDGHPLGIVHRDISPNNVLISEHGEVKLADFGIAKAMNKREQTGTGVVKGKVSFMSPEQALGRAIDARSDVFSLGTLLYLSMLGVRPFDGSTDLETLLRVQRGDFKAPSRVRPDLSPELARIIERAMRFLPDERYPTADDMLLDLERVLRTQFGGVGQTELKQYLAELGRLDGVPPIGRAGPLIEDRESSSGGALLEGNAVVLADAKDDLADERTDLAELTAVEGEESPRFTRRTVDLARAGSLQGQGMGGREATPGRSGPHGVDIFSRELTPQRSTRRIVEELSIPEGAVNEEAPERFRRKKSRTLPVVMTIIILAGAAFGVARYLGLVGAPAAPPVVAAPAMAPVVPSVTPPPPPVAPPKAPKVAAAPTPAAPPPEAPKEAAKEAPKEAPKEAAKEPVNEAAPAIPGAPAEKPAVGEKAARRGPKAPRERDVFKESAKRVRSLSQGIDQFPPGTIQLTPPTGDTP
ncbi:MAG TPA: serine/threonine-protein kinase [Polyangia bacterium]|jgi:serine/threonine-protein kinase